MVFFECKIGEKTYTLERLTLGGARILKREFGLDELESFNSTDPDQLVGLLVLCIKAERPDADLDDLIAEVEAMDIDEFSLVDDDDEDEDEAASGPTEPPEPVAKSGSRATSRKTSGTPA